MNGEIIVTETGGLLAVLNYGKEGKENCSIHLMIAVIVIQLLHMKCMKMYSIWVKGKCCDFRCSKFIWLQRNNVTTDRLPFILLEIYHICIEKVLYFT